MTKTRLMIALVAMGYVVAPPTNAADSVVTPIGDGTGSVSRVPTELDTAKHEIQRLADKFENSDSNTAWERVAAFRQYAFGTNRLLRSEAIEVLQNLSARTWPEGMAAPISSLLSQIEESERLRGEGDDCQRNESGEIVKVGFYCNEIPVDCFTRHSKRLDTIREMSFVNLREPADLNILRHCPKLEKLTLFDSPVTDWELSEICGLRHLKSLVFFNCNKLSGRLISRLDSLPQLQELTLSRHQIGNLAVLSEASNLKILRCDATEMTDNELGRLPHHSSLRMLSLTHAERITDAGIAHLGRLTGLAELAIPGSQLTDAGLHALLENRSFTGLWVSGCRLTDECADDLARQSSLRSLGISKTGVGDGTARKLDELPSLSWLSLTGTFVTDAGVQGIARCPQLTVLYLPRTVATPATERLLDTRKSLSVYYR